MSFSFLSVSVVRTSSFGCMIPWHDTCMFQPRTRYGYITFAMHIHHVPCITYPLRYTHVIHRTRVFKQDIRRAPPSGNLSRANLCLHGVLFTVDKLTSPVHLPDNSTTTPPPYPTVSASHCPTSVVVLLFFCLLFDALQHLHLLRPGLIDHVATRKYLPLQCYMAGPASLAIPA